MKEQIKELRVKLDGLAQLVKSLTGPVFAIDTALIPYNLDIDAFIQKWKENSNFMIPISLNKAIESINSHELGKSYDSLILAKAWLGKILGELGESTPYGNDGQRKTIEDIEPTADKAKVVPELRNLVPPGAVCSGEMVDTWELNGKPMDDYDNMNHIERVDWLRESIKNLAENLPNYEEWLQEQIDNFYTTVKEDSKENFSNKEEEFMSSLPILEFEFSLVYKYLCEARFWLGFELQRIREHGKA